MDANKKLEEQLHKLWGFCSDDNCSSRCTANLRAGMKLINDYVKEEKRESYKQGYVKGGIDEIMRHQRAAEKVNL